MTAAAKSEVWYDARLGGRTEDRESGMGLGPSLPLRMTARVGV